MVRIPDRNIMTGLHASESQNDYGSKRKDAPPEQGGCGCLTIILIIIAIYIVGYLF